MRLTVRELDLLEYFVQRPDEVVSREDLLVHVWGYHPDTLTRTVDSTLSRLRKKLESNPKRPIFFESVYGQGYRFNTPAPASPASVTVPSA